MALFRCNKCGHMREVGSNYIGKLVKCPHCQQTTQIYDTVKFVDALIKKYIIQSKEIKKLQKEPTETSGLEIQGIENYLTKEVDIYNTKAFTHVDMYAPIVEWFENRKIQVQINEEAIDTTGFFDEVALSLGDNYSVLKFVSDKIKYIQNKGFDNVKLQLSNKTTYEIEQIILFCKQMHNYSFIARYHHQKNEKTIHLKLQTAPRIKEFFNGI
ncbi:MAG TPA: hypothetical protein ENI62_04630, partial [Gammaproteobacteria bacterium]|nr:hypothetical protein [Gammaproteobacteria bacterium]